MNNRWAAAIVIPLVVAVIVAVGIVGVGELYLAIGETPAIVAAIVLMAGITAVAAILSTRMTSSH